MLTQLDLCFPDTLRVPSSVRFSSLKLLTLEYVKFVDDVSTERMLSGAALERLFLNKCDWADLQVLNVSAPKLRSLRVTEARCDGDRSGNGNCKIVIHGPGLKYFYCSGGLLYDYTISGSSMPVEAMVEVDYVDYVPYARSDPVDRWHRPLKGLLNVKFLTLRGLSFRIDSPLHDALPVFRNLITLKLSIGVMCLSSPTLAAILRRSPRLENLEFTKGLRVDHRLVDGILDPPPPCFSSSLKRITVGAFFGTEAEMLALRILLRTAKVLEEIILSRPGDHLGFDEYLIRDLAELVRQNTTD
ncbi:F-box/LRR-repeat protein At3g58980-like [Syzygium oleosum]|uniref:F-box/LRR-repeat protein At3g58980-like n=1 Tax=Syzygium oleosum TaxID=219896 RepID=UPI0011D2A9A1|nr:F-box/LRR-repeat protein At3g58980-like [Syzygium oleosum]